MNDRHPSGTSTVPAPDASYPYDDGYTHQGTGHGYAAYDGYSTGTFDHLGTAYGEGDPLFGSLSGGYGTDTGYGTDPNAGYGHGQSDHSGQYDATQWGATGAYGTGAHHTDAAGTGAFETGAYQTGTFQTGTYDTGAHETGAYETSGYDQNATGAYDTASGWDGSAYQLADATGQWLNTGGQWGDDAAGQWDTTAQWDGTGQWGATGYDQDPEAAAAHLGAQAPHAPEPVADTYDAPGAYETTAGTDTGQTQFWDSSAYTTLDDATYETQPHEQQPYDPPGYESSSYAEAAPEAGAHESPYGESPYEPYEPAYGSAYDPAPEAEPEPRAAAEAESGHEPADGSTPDADSVPRPRRSRPAAAPVARKDVGARSRRRPTSSRPKRSAILTVAVPSVCALGVTAVAAASVSGMGDKDGQSTQAADDTTYKPSAANTKMDTQLAGLSTGADDFAVRASRTQERQDLKARQEAERKKREAEAARKEALRPKFVLPVSQHGLSAYFGQAGVNWMSVHTGIDFPVSYGTTVMAATDGTVRTQWNSAYGNMAIVTAPDGTETWYCHLSSTKIRSGSVKAGDVIAYSGNSGNSTGPHLHFEVRPGGGSAVDPLPWLRSHGLDPT